MPSSRRIAVVFFAALIGASALIGATISAFITVELVRRTGPNTCATHLAYGLLPAVGYLALFVAAVTIYKELDIALDVLAGALLLLLLINVRNTWDLMLSMVRHQTGRH